MKRLKNIFIKICIFSILLTFSACNEWLNVEPVGVQTSDTYWQTSDEVEQVLMSTYMQLRVCQPYFFKWGELRASSGLEYGGPHGTANDQGTNDERLLRRLDIRPSNSLTKWSDVYVAIGRANSVVQFAPNALKTDMTFSPELCNSFIAEAVFMRSLCYFYLVRTFRDVPYIIEPYSEDNMQFAVDVTDGNKILEGVIADLEEWEKKCKPGFEVEWQTKGRATKWAYYALMADIYLWQGRYADVRKMYQLLKNNGGFSLATNEEYWSIFHPGNNPKESIFELQFRGHLEGQKNNLFGEFHSTNLDGRYVISKNARDNVESSGEIDIRGKGRMYDDRYIGNKYWKYLGTQSRKDSYFHDTHLRPDRDRSPNWIFYRFSDVVLMEAEAMTMEGVAYGDVCDFLEKTIRKRAGLNLPMTIPTTEREMLKTIFSERLKEFLGEGKIWFDILRMARHNNYKYRDLLIEELSRMVPAKDRPLWKLRLQDEYGHYLPINREEIIASYGILTQNPFYQGLE